MTLSNLCFRLTRSVFTCAVGAALVATMLSGTATASGLLSARPLNSYASHDNYNPNEQRPRVVTDGMGNWLSMWITSGPTSNWTAQSGLAFASSTTNGTTWSTPVTPDLLSGNIVISADLAYAGNGRWIAMWISEPTGGTLLDRQVTFTTSNDLGQTWSAPQTITQESPTEKRPHNWLQLESDKSGNLMALWLQDGPGTASFKIVTCRSSDNGATWSPPASPSGIDDNIPVDKQARIAYVPDGKWLLVYFSNRTISDVVVPIFSVAKSNDFGASWTDVGPLFRNAVDYRVQPAFDIEARNGKVVIAATSPWFPRPENTFTDGVGIYVSDDSLTTFSTSLWVETAEVNATGFVTVAADDSGNWLLAAKAENPGETVPEYPEMNPVLLWRSTDPGTTWTVTSGPASGGVNSHMQLAGTGTGDFVMVMEHYGPPETLADADVDVLSVSTGDSGNTWSGPALVNSPDPADLASSSDTRVDMEAGSGIIIACWLANAEYPPGQFNYPASRISPIMVSRSIDDGRTWSAAAPLPGAYGEFSSPCTVRFLGDSTWECTWETGLFSQEFLKSQSADGGLTWSAPAPAAEMPARNNSVAVGTAGNAVRVSSQTLENTPTAGIYTLETYVETSSDNGSTWEAPQVIHSETRPAMNVASVYTGEPAVVYAGFGRFALLIKNIYVGRDLPFDGNHLQSVNLYLAESYNNGDTWGTPETVLQSDRIPTYYDTPFVASNSRIVIGWAEHGRNAVTGNDADIFYRAKMFGATSAARDWSLFE